MIDWTNIVVRGIVALLASAAAIALLWSARRGGKVEQELKDQLAGEKTKAEIVEKSDASAEAAATRSDPRVHDAVNVVPNISIPDWSKRH
mgnify:FL=1